MIRCRILIVAVMLVASFYLSGCHHQEKKSHKLTIEGPNKKTELKLETTKTDKHD